jgi:hypothetical protein
MEIKAKAAREMTRAMLKGEKCSGGGKSMSVFMVESHSVHGEDVMNREEEVSELQVFEFMPVWDTKSDGSD